MAAQQSPRGEKKENRVGDAEKEIVVAEADIIEALSPIETLDEKRALPEQQPQRINSPLPALAHMPGHFEGSGSVGDGKVVVDALPTLRMHEHGRVDVLEEVPWGETTDLFECCAAVGDARTAGDGGIRCVARYLHGAVKNAVAVAPWVPRRNIEGLVGRDEADFRHGEIAHRDIEDVGVRDLVRIQHEEERCGGAGVGVIEVAGAG